jgi:hypothetical protein
MKSALRSVAAVLVIGYGHILDTFARNGFNFGG